MRCLHPPLEGEGRLALSEANARRGGGTVSAPDIAHEERLSPRPAARFTRVDPPPPGEGKKTSRRQTMMTPQRKSVLQSRPAVPLIGTIKKLREVSACRQ